MRSGAGLSEEVIFPGKGMCSETVPSQLDLQCVHLCSISEKEGECFGQRPDALGMYLTYLFSGFVCLCGANTYVCTAVHMLAEARGQP